MSTPIITDELIETLKGIKDGKEWEWQGATLNWNSPPAGSNVFSYAQHHPIRLKPFVPVPPEGYRLLGDEEKDGRWAAKAVCWESATKEWVDGLWKANVAANHYAVPIAPPEPEPEYVPWTAETFPTDRPVWVKFKDEEGAALITQFNEDCAIIGDVGWRAYGDLFRNWLQHNGSPCGELKK